MTLVSTDSIIELPINSIYPSPENDELYKPIDPRDPAIKALAESIATIGLREPITVTSDYFILSGHRRYAASRLAGLTTVPIIVNNDVSHDDDPDQFVRLLREHNRQRVKSFDEVAREEAVSADPEESYRVLVEHRRQKSTLIDFSEIEMDLGAAKTRKRISAAKVPMLNAINRVLVELKEFWPVSLRKIHYDLLNDPPLRHASKPNFFYINDDRSYHSLTELATRARLTGLIPWEAIDDDSRLSEAWGLWSNSQPYIARELNQFLKGYYRDLLQSQPNHIEIFAEKFTLKPIIYPLAMEYTIPLTIGKGSCSMPPRKKLVQRYKKSGKDGLIILLLSDFDPDGVVIAESFARSMRDDFKLDVKAIRVAVTHEQATTMNLPPAQEAKKSSRNYAKFAKKYGDTTYELEAIKPRLLQQIIRDSVDSILDIDAFNHEVDQEKNEAAHLDTYRRAALKMLGKGAA